MASLASRLSDLIIAVGADIKALKATQVPTGGVILWPGPESTIPAGFLKLNGATLSRATYSKLADARGVAANATTFTLENMTGRFPRGNNSTGPSLSGGNDTHTHTVNAHNHTVALQMGDYYGAAAFIGGLYSWASGVWTGWSTVAFNGYGQHSGYAGAGTTTMNVQQTTGDTNYVAPGTDGGLNIPYYHGFHFIVKT